MKVFWAHGYAAASLDQLVTAMGLSKSSFYHAFGCKRELMIAAIDYYTDRQMAEVDEMWRDRSFTEGLRLLCKSVTGDNCGGWGCLLVNSAAEIAPHDPDIKKHIQAGFKRTISHFKNRILQAQKEGEVPAARNAQELASYLVSSLAGLRILAKGGISRSALTAVQANILSVLTAKPA